MHRVIVIGSVNHDRIWRLDAPLTPGGRLNFSERITHLGGGGFFTGCQLLDLGADVTLVSRLMQDDEGLKALEALNDRGFDTGQIVMLPGETMPLEILLEPDGERTIISPPRFQPPMSAHGLRLGDAAYVNTLALDQALVAALDGMPLVVSQLPLRPAVPRPADYVITSKADVGADAGTDPGAVWQKAQQVASPRLKRLVITDGPRPVTLFDGHSIIQVDTTPVSVVGSTIGAGDRFSGALLYYLLEGHDAPSAVREAGRVVADWLRAPRN